jgi:hypothetical protein
MVITSSSLMILGNILCNMWANFFGRDGLISPLQTLPQIENGMDGQSTHTATRQRQDDCFLSAQNVEIECLEESSVHCNLGVY